jgi:hypothetical protein
MPAIAENESRCPGEQLGGLVRRLARHDVIVFRADHVGVRLDRGQVDRLARDSELPLSKQVLDIEVPEIERVHRPRHFRAVVIPCEDVEHRRIFSEQPVRHDIVEYQVVGPHYVNVPALERAARLRHLLDMIDRRFVGAAADGGVGPSQLVLVDGLGA